MSSIMKREIIALDLDDVISAHVESFISFSNKTYGTNLTTEDYVDEWTDLWGVDFDESERRRLEFQIDENIMGFKLKPEVAETLNKLKAKHDLYIVTARRKHFTDLTNNWVNKHLPGLFKEIHLVPVHDPESKITKADICKLIGANYFIDDMPKQCNLVAKEGIKSILFGDFSWNRKEKIISGVTRCKNWSEVLKYFSVNS